MPDQQLPDHAGHRAGNPVDDDLDGVVDLVEEAVADVGASARWLRDGLRETFEALGIRDSGDPAPHER
jgi:hypothetical protein